MNNAKAIESLAARIEFKTPASDEPEDDFVGDDNRRVATDLVSWYNVSDLIDADLRILAELYLAGGFRAWDCLTCGDRVYEGSPENWDNFQGVCQVDYVSYPEGSRKQCDYCRCHHPAQCACLRHDESDG